MKILKIFGVVVGVHVFALILIFANPGCSSATKPAPAETSSAESDPAIAPAETSPVTVADAGSTSPEPLPMIRFSPTRPGTPAASALETSPVTDVTPVSTYTIVKGDSLWTVARKNRLTVSELAAANNLKAGTPVRVGQKLIIPSKQPAATAVTVDPAVAAPTATEVSAASKTNRETVRHVVKSGETLGAIARKYQVKVGEIATANSIADPAKIRPGMELIIPGWQAPAARAAKSSPAPAATTSPAATPPAESAAPVENVPTIVIPAPGDEPDSTKPSSSEAPVIQVEEGTGFRL